MRDGWGRGTDVEKVGVGRHGCSRRSRAREVGSMGGLDSGGRAACWLERGREPVRARPRARDGEARQPRGRRRRAQTAGARSQPGCPIAQPHSRPRRAPPGTEGAIASYLRRGIRLTKRASGKGGYRRTTRVERGGGKGGEPFCFRARRGASADQRGEKGSFGGQMRERYTWRLGDDKREGRGSGGEGRDRSRKSEVRW